MNGTLLEQQALTFSKEFEANKQAIDPKYRWYPYGTLGNFIHLKNIFNKFPLETLIGPSKKTLDIGAADGDLAFFLETLGYNSDIIDFPPTNYNNLEGARLIKKQRNSNVNIFEYDLDSQFPALQEKYDLIFFLGILYHLKNPYYILERLSHSTKNLIVSTRVARYTKDGTALNKYPVAYLLAPDECNNDATNFWIFSVRGLEQIFNRTGWNITEMITVGDTKKSNPSDQNHDERAYALLSSRNF